MTDFEALLSTLQKNEVEFIVIGGAAAVAHGAARLTQVLDIVYRRTPSNLDRLVNALREHKAYLRGAPRPAVRLGNEALAELRAIEEESG
jgi:hypothetical protein